jgi:uncharacterized protein YjbI with pentapeptide repeats
MGQARRETPKAPRLPASLREVEGLPLDDDLSGLVLRGNFTSDAREDLSVERSHIVHAQFTAAECARLRLTDVLVENTDFSGTDLDEATFTRVVFRDCKMSGVVLSRSSLRDVVLTGCRLNEANFRMSASSSVVFEGVDLRQADFYAASMGGTRFFDCDLTAAQFSKTDASGVRFHGSKLSELKGAQSLSGAVIDSSQVYPVALGLLSELHVQIDDERDRP